MPAQKFVTPVCECMYPFLQQPNISKDGEYEPAFKISLILDASNKEHHDLLIHIKNLHAEAVKKKPDDPKLKTYGKYPIKPYVDEAGNTIPDTYMVTFKTKQQFVDHIACFDAKGNRIYREKNFIANHSKVCVSWSYGFYSQGGGGVSLYLNGVQIIELIEWQGYTAESLGFSETEGYVAQEESQEVKDFIEAFPDETLEADNKVDDDLPF